MTEGNKTARVLGARFIQAKTGTLGIEIAFKTEEGKINWCGWLSPKAIENTMATLVEVLGFNGDDSVDANGILNAKALNKEKDVELVVVNEVNPEDGKTYPRVKWVNNPGGGSAFKVLTPEIVKSQLAVIGFKNAYAGHKAAMGGAVAPIQKNAPIPTEEIPF